MSTSTHDPHAPIAYHGVWVKTPITHTTEPVPMFAYLAAFGPQFFFTFASVNTQHRALELMRLAALTD